MAVTTWAQAILTAAGSSADLVTVTDDQIPDELFITRALTQHILVDSSHARRLLGWSDGNPDQALRTSVAWHLAHAAR